MTIEELLAKLEGVTSNGEGWKAKCVAHADDVASLSLREGDDGKILLKCFAGCTVDNIAHELGVEVKDLFPAGDRGAGKTEVARYPYRNAAGEKLYEKVRYEPKDFRITPRGYKGPRVPYRLPELLASGDKKIVWVEGERDVDTLSRLGLIATTAGGANDWRAELAPHFANREVVIIPDSDDAGRDHARRVATALMAVAKRVTVCHLDGPKDVTDWLAKHNNDRGKLVAYIKANEQPFGCSALQTFAEVEKTDEAWVWFPRIAYGAVTLVFGEAGIGKSTIMLDMIARLSRGKSMPQSTEQQPAVKTLVVGIEGPITRTRDVLAASGADLGNVALVRQELTPEPDKGPLEQLPYVEALMRQFGAKLLFVDNVAESMQSDTDSNNEFSVRRSMRRLTQLAERNGWAIVMISHPKKNASFSNVKEAITGSQAFTNLPRATFFVAPVIDEQGNRTHQCAMACAKSNLYDALRVNTLVYELRSNDTDFRDEHAIMGAPTVHWVGVTPMSAQELLESTRPRKEEKERQAPKVDAGLVDIATDQSVREVPAPEPQNVGTAASRADVFMGSETTEQFIERMGAGDAEPGEYV